MVKIMKLIQYHRPGHCIIVNGYKFSGTSLYNGNGAASDSIGTFTVTNLTLNNDAVFDWEITDFDGTAGSDWDLLLDNLVWK